jgi:hypothetical protein
MEVTHNASDEQQPDPYLITDGNVERCSVCGHPFPSDVKPSMSVAFARHLLKAHQSAAHTPVSS